MRTIRNIAGAAAAALLAAACAGRPAMDDSGPVPEFDRKADWAVEAFDAPVIDLAELRGALARDPSAVLLVDTRAQAEIDASRIPGAIAWPRYRWTTPPPEVRRHAEEGGLVLFYCSIGYRSGDACVRASRALGPDARVANLRGGIFQWANEGEPLEGGMKVHGYDEEWGRLLRPDLLVLP